MTKKTFIYIRTAGDVREVSFSDVGPRASEYSEPKTRTTVDRENGMKYGRQASMHK